MFKFTTNPQIATGDGVAMGLRAGLKVRDTEFIQFHPTALAKKLTPMFLISETVRGEGAKLLNSKGKRFTKEMASRDIVAREIYRELNHGQVFLDIRHKKRPFLKKRFPQIYAKLKKYKFDMAKDKFPVTPAAHYISGGIVTDLNGQTRLKNLFAFGEVTCTGVHGANRLASNTLLEALVFSNQIAEKLKPQKIPQNILVKSPKLVKTSTQPIRHEIQDLMWHYAGIIRNRK